MSDADDAAGTHQTLMNRLDEIEAKLDRVLARQSSYYTSTMNGWSYFASTSMVQGFEVVQQVYATLHWLQTKPLLKYFHYLPLKWKHTLIALYILWIRFWHQVWRYLLRRWFRWYRLFHR